MQNVFLQNKTEIEKMINRENARRNSRNLPLLTPHEEEYAAAEMVEIAASGGRVRSYQFPPLEELEREIKGSPQPPPDVSDKVLQLKQKALSAAQSAPANKTQTAHAHKKNENSFIFISTVCENGFLINVTDSNGEEKQFIFRNEKELMIIFKKVLFKRLYELHESRKKEDDNEPRSEQVKRDEPAKRTGPRESEPDKTPRKDTGVRKQDKNASNC